MILTFNHSLNPSLSLTPFSSIPVILLKFVCVFQLLLTKFALDRLTEGVNVALQVV